MDDALYFSDREDWRSWLAKNHNKESQVWLILNKKSLSENGLNLEQSVEEAICFGWIDGKLRRIDDKKFLEVFSTESKECMVQDK